MLDLSGTIEVCGEDNQCHNSDNMTADRWNDVEITQRPDGDYYLYEVKVNGVVVASTKSYDPVEFEEVDIFASDPWLSGLDGSIRDLTVIPTIEGNPFLSFLSDINFEKSKKRIQLSLILE